MTELAPVANAPVGRLDRLGAALSLGCALHCLAWPIAFSVLPGLSSALRSFQHPWHDWAILALRLGAMEPWFITVAVLLALASTARGWQRHGRASPFGIAIMGAAVLPGGMLSGNHAVLHILLAAGGGLLLAAAHWSNLRYLKQAAGTLTDADKHAIE